MKPIQLVLLVTLAVAALGLAAWMGRSPVKSGAGKAAPLVVPDLPLPAKGPFGKAGIKDVEFKFGTAEVGSKGSHAFIIKNEGEGPLRLKTGKTSCGQCTVAKQLPKDTLAPGESVEVEVSWEIKSSNEMFRQWAEVFTTDPDRRRIELVVEGRIERSLNLVPDGEWALGALSETAPTTVRGTVFSNMVDEIVITEVECKNPLVSVKWEPSAKRDPEAKEPKASVDVEVTVAAGAPLGLFHEVVKLHTSVKNGATVEFSLRGQRSGPIEMKGPGWNSETNTVVLGEFPAAKGAKARLFLYVRDMEGELEVKEIIHEHDEVQIRPSTTGKPVGKSKVYEIEVEVPPGDPVYRRGKEAEAVELKLNHPAVGAFKMFVSYHSI